MFFIVLVLSVFAFFKTIGYAIYEYKENNNKAGVVVIVLLSIITLILPCVITVI